MLRLDETSGRRGKRKEKQRERDFHFWDICRQKKWDEAVEQFRSDFPPTSDHLDQYDGILAFTYANLCHQELAGMIEEKFSDVRMMEKVYYNRRLRNYTQGQLEILNLMGTFQDFSGKKALYISKRLRHNLCGIS